MITSPDHENDALLGDWVGLAGYLAEAVANDDVTIDTARTALTEAATGVLERRALARAVEFAAAQLGPDSLTTQL